MITKVLPNAGLFVKLRALRGEWFALLLRKVGIRFYFFDLRGVPGAMR